MNTPLEVMKAIVDNSGPVEAWVKNYVSRPWSENTIQTALLKGRRPFISYGGDDYAFCSLTDPNANHLPIPDEWTHDWASWRAVDADGRLFEYADLPTVVANMWRADKEDWYFVSTGHDPTNWRESLEKRPRKTRPMTPREAALFLHGQPYAIRFKADTEIYWTSDTALNDDTDVGYWQYADLRDPGFPRWQNFPEVDV